MTSSRSASSTERPAPGTAYAGSARHAKTPAIRPGTGGTGSGPSATPSGRRPTRSVSGIISVNIGLSMRSNSARVISVACSTSPARSTKRSWTRRVVGVPYAAEHRGSAGPCTSTTTTRPALYAGPPVLPVQRRDRTLRRRHASDSRRHRLPRAWAPSSGARPCRTRAVRRPCLRTPGRAGRRCGGFAARRDRRLRAYRR
jgi:hypothetical protein